MKAVIQTQIRENYGAHDWDGVGECPQYWKMKGGNTYIIDCSIEDNQSPKWWQRVEAAITERSESWEEYIISETVVDDIDFRVEDHCAEWDTPYYGIVKTDRVCFGRTIINDEFGYLRSEIARQYDAYDVLNGGERVYHPVSYLMNTGEQLTHSELADWFSQRESA